MLVLRGLAAFLATIPWPNPAALPAQVAPAHLPVGHANTAARHAMCRYATADYRTSYACLPCRHVAQFPRGTAPRCPRCRATLLDLGRDFQAPRKRDDAGWKAVALNVAAGRLFDSCGCNGPGYRPRTPAQARRQR